MATWSLVGSAWILPAYYSVLDTMLSHWSDRTVIDKTSFGYISISFNVFAIRKAAPF